MNKRKLTATFSNPTKGYDENSFFIFLQPQCFTL